MRLRGNAVAAMESGVADIRGRCDNARSLEREKEREREREKGRFFFYVRIICDPKVVSDFNLISPR
jgi:hypothetical protein